MPRWILLATLVALASSASASVREPTGRWLVNFDESKCAATRNYGTKEDASWLLLKQPPHRSVMQMQWITDGSEMEPQQFKGTIQFGDGPEIPVSILNYHADNPSRRVFEMNVPIEKFQEARQADKLQFRSNYLHEQLRLTSLEPLLRTMDRCVADLRDYWNFSDNADADAPNARLKSPAQGNLASWFDSDDYPWMALVRKQGGKVGFSLLIDEKGAVADCSVVEPSGFASLDAMACVVLTQRARLTPAIGLDGKPARDSMFGRVRWVVP